MESDSPSNSHEIEFGCSSAGLAAGLMWRDGDRPGRRRTHDSHVVDNDDHSPYDVAGARDD